MNISRACLALLNFIFLNLNYMGSQLIHASQVSCRLSIAARIAIESISSRLARNGSSARSSSPAGLIYDILFKIITNIIDSGRAYQGIIPAEIALKCLFRREWLKDLI